MEVALKWLYTNTLAASIFTSISIFIAFYLVSQNQRKRSYQPLPPSPWALPVIGHLHLLKNPLHRKFKNLSDEYGHVFGLKLGNQYTVVVSSPAAVEECFSKNDIVLADRPQIEAGKYLNYDSSTIGASNYGDHWRYVRRISSQEVFCVARQNMFLSLRQEEVKAMIKSLFSLTKQEKQKVEMKSRISVLTFNIIVRIVTGKRYYGEGVEDSAEARDFCEMISEIFKLGAASNPADFLPFLKLFDYGGYKKKMVKLEKRLDEVLQNLIDESKVKNGGDVESMLSNILQLQQEDPDSISDKIIKGLMVVLITAGTDTAAATIEWAMSLLCNNPEKLKKAQLELDAIIGPGRLVEEADLPKLTYLQAIINETFRLYPAAPLLVPHYSSKECMIQGFYIPRGTMVFANAWAIHRDPELWKEPLKFEPERFADVEENYAHKLIPFGRGRRSCPGASMAHKVVGLALASLIQCFEWERIGEVEVDMSEGDGLTMPKLIPLEAMCQPRNNMINVLSNLV